MIYLKYTSILFNFKSVKFQCSGLILTRHYFCVLQKLSKCKPLWLRNSLYDASITVSHKFKSSSYLHKYMHMNRKKKKVFPPVKYRGLKTTLISRQSITRTNWRIKSSYLFIVQVNMIEHVNKQQNSCNLHCTSDYMSGYSEIQEMATKWKATHWHYSDTRSTNTNLIIAEKFAEVKIWI